MPQQQSGGFDDYPFCLLPSARLDSSNAGAVTWDTNAGPIEEKATIRVGWSSLGLHFQVHVDDPHVSPAPAGDNLWNGDGVEIFAKGDNQRTGPFDGTGSDLGAMQVVITAPTGGAVRGLFYFGSATQPLDPKDYSGRIVAGGYEIYLLLRWDVLRPVLQDASAPVSPLSGQKVALDFALDVKGGSSASRDAQLLYVANPVQGAPSPGCSPPAPFCDDRVWCASTLE